MSSKKLSANKLTDAQLVKTGNEARRLSAKPSRADSKQAQVLAMLHRKQGAKALAIAATAVVTMGAAPPSAHYSPRSRLEKGSIASAILLSSAANCLVSSSESTVCARSRSICTRSSNPRTAPPVTSATQGSGFKSLAVTKFSSTIFRSRRKAANSKMAFMFNFPI
jgi:hypothetical protein